MTGSAAVEAETSAAPSRWEIEQRVLNVLVWYLDYATEIVHRVDAAWFLDPVLRPVVAEVLAVRRDGSFTGDLLVEVQERLLATGVHDSKGDIAVVYGLSFPDGPAKVWGPAAAESLEQAHLAATMRRRFVDWTDQIDRGRDPVLVAHAATRFLGSIEGRAA